MDTTRSLFEVQLKWKQDSHAKFFDKKKGGQSLSSAEPLPSELVKQEYQNQQNLKSILYLQDAYNPQDHKTLTTVQLTLQLKKATSSSPQTLSAALQSVDIAFRMKSETDAPPKGCL